MHKYFSSKKGITLTELIVSTTLIGIVLVGVASFDHAVKSLQGATRRASILPTRVSAAMTFLKEDAAKAIGDLSNPGVASVGLEKDHNTLCFRHDIVIGAPTKNYTPHDYTDDMWVCYTAKFVDSTLTRCEIDGSAPLPSSYDCTAEAVEGAKIILSNLSEPKFFNKNPTFAIDPNEVKSIHLSLTTLFNTDEPEDAMKNPSYTLTTRISPSAHSR